MYLFLLDSLNTLKKIELNIAEGKIYVTNTVLFFRFCGENYNS